MSDGFKNTICSGRVACQKVPEMLLSIVLRSVSLCVTGHEIHFGFTQSVSFRLHSRTSVIHSPMDALSCAQHHRARVPCISPDGRNVTGSGGFNEAHPVVTTMLVGKVET